MHATTPVVDVDHSKIEEQLLSLQNEIGILRLLEHDHVVRYLFSDTRITDDTGNITMMVFMEFVAGGSSQSIVDSHGALSEATTAAFAVQILLGLVYLHENHVSHRDIKVGNCLVSAHGVVKLADFGTSILMETASQETKVGMTPKREDSPSTMIDTIGAPAYMAPEAIRGDAGDDSFPSDIWSFGCCILPRITGMPP